MSRKLWFKRGTLGALLDLLRIRGQMRRENLFSTEREPRRPSRPEEAPESAGWARTADGSYNDLRYPEMGKRGERFGRNFPLDRSMPDRESLLDPNPREISRRLLTRREFKPARSVNLLAAAWIQFQQHGWFNHLEERRQPTLSYDDPDAIEVPLAEDDPWPGAEPEPEPGAWKRADPDRFRPIRISRTESDPRPDPDAEGQPPTFRNTVSHWWDASQLYGTTEDQQRSLRSGIGGKLVVGPDGGLPYDDTCMFPNIPAVGFRDNWWVGLGLLYELFIREHNAVCDHLAGHHPDFDDQTLFDKARLVVSALLAKIHTVEWTPGLLQNEPLTLAMRANWFGLKREKKPLYRYVVARLGQLLDFFRGPGRRSEAYHGILSTETDHHAADYSMTEEFAAMYRMHPLIPDDYAVWSADDGKELDQLNLFDVQGRRASEVLRRHSTVDLLYSFGRSHPGALRLHNYPRFLQNLERENGDRFDLATIDILRDRERGVPRYNDFREGIGKTRLTSFREISDDPEIQRELEDIYGSVDKVDLLIGMLAEPLPPGFAFSDTTFRVFILMASRRLKSDRFFTEDYRPEVYTQEGLEWIEQNDMGSTLRRHYPETETFCPVGFNAFLPWKDPHA